MKLPRRTVLGLGLGALATKASLTQSSAAAPSTTSAGAGAKAEKCFDIGKHTVITQKTPDFTVKGTTDKKTTPKDWLEVEFQVELEKLPEEFSDKKDVQFLDGVEAKFYVYMAVNEKEKRKTLTATVNYMNVPLKEKMHVVVYLSPATIYNLTGDRTAKPSAVTMVGLEIFHGGKQLGRYDEGGKEWWKAPNAPPAEEGRLLPKSKTPFAPLWFDYHWEEKVEKV